MACAAAPDPIGAAIVSAHGSQGFQGPGPRYSHTVTGASFAPVMKATASDMV